MFDCERELDITETRLSGRIWKRSLQTRARFDDIRAKRFQPALRFPLQVLEGALGREFPGHTPSSRSCLKSAELQAGRRFNDGTVNPTGWE